MKFQTNAEKKLIANAYNNYGFKTASTEYNLYKYGHFICYTISLQIHFYFIFYSR